MTSTIFLFLNSRCFKPIKMFLKKLFSFRNAGDMIPMSTVPNLFGAWQRCCSSRSTCHINSANQDQYSLHTHLITFMAITVSFINHLHLILIAIPIFNLFSWRNTLLVALVFLLTTLFLWFQGGWFIIIITFWCTAIWISLLFLCLWWRFWLWWSWSWINFLCFLLSLVSSLCRWDLVAMCGLARFHGSA